MNLKAISRPCALLALLVLTASAPSAMPQQSQYPILDKLAQKVIQKYQTTSCGGLEGEKRSSEKAPNRPIRHR